MELRIFPITKKTHPKPFKRTRLFVYKVTSDLYKHIGVGVLLYFIGISFGIQYPSGEVSGDKINGLSKSF